MATNATEKDQALQQIMDYCEQRIDDIGHCLDIIEVHQDISNTLSCLVQGRIEAYDDITRKCKDMLVKETEDEN